MELMEARRRILLNSPHIEDKSGVIANLQTDMKAPLKKCVVSFSPIQEGSGEPSPDNIRPISGWDGINVYTLNSENLIPLGAPDDAFAGQLESSGAISGSSNYECFCVHVGKNTTFQYQRDETGVTTLIAFADEYLTSRTGAVTYGYLNMRNRATRTVNSGEHPYLVLCNVKNNYHTAPTTIETRHIMLSIGEGVKNFAERKPIIKIPISWQTEAGTVYGGTLDVLSGVLTVDMEYGQVTAEYLSSRASGYIGYISSVTALGGYPAVWVRNLFSRAKDRVSGGIRAYCNAFPIRMYDTNISSSQNRCAFAVDGTTINSVETFISAVSALEQNGGGLYVAYELKTPIIYQLTPQEILTLKGVNNIWTNGGDIDIEYWTH